MAEHGNGDSTAVVKAGEGASNGYAIDNPGLPPHRPRLADVDEKAAKRSERQVAALFIVSIIGTLMFFVGYFAIARMDQFDDYFEGMSALRVQNTLIGVGTALAMLGIGLGIVHWAKTLMPDHEVTEARKPLRTEADRAEAEKIVTDVVEETQIKRRPLLRNTMIAAALLAPLPAVVVFRDLDRTADFGVERMRHSLWDEGVRLVRDPTGTPIRAADLTIGSAMHVIPENLREVSGHGDRLAEKAKAVVLIMRLNPDDLHEPTPGRENWSHEGIIACSKVCTHVGCPVALYERHTHHLLCPCHQSTFDASEEFKVTFGPAGRALPQLPITVDDEGFLIARSDFTEPVGPTYWERGHTDPEGDFPA
ncbi:cytochrome bc1 complex Rieske iron-sulfur subunit [Nesterenkonia natronophila]|uniref:Cytochrome bc1 complex Rieske iron-sulfur subunit n=1 Tax=Nesterenkonia natronophila TaxID=2174932 RepID=A0A3A4EZR8_9MICC|nr:Rieske 2Fe-2S domain-containing protein [Nesterenkonia natronophila]RJN31126.1 Rieske (2Fe-2S) protein [Nesterenkonia natronophila]